MENQNINTERVTITLGDATFQLQEQHDLNWIHELGHVFCVFDEQDSGNISFGFNINGTRRFLKYAGARPLEYKGMPEDAAKRLSAAVAVYQKLEHPHLIKLVDHFATRDGYAALFEWFDGENLHPHWVFPPPSKYEHPDSPFFSNTGNYLSDNGYLRWRSSLGSMYMWSPKGWLRLIFMTGASCTIFTIIRPKSATLTSTVKSLPLMTSGSNSGVRRDPNHLKNTHLEHQSMHGLMYSQWERSLSVCSAGKWTAAMRSGRQEIASSGCLARSQS